MSVDRPYDNREELAIDIVRVLREEIHFLLAAGAALVQIDEPVLTEVVFGAPPREGAGLHVRSSLGEKGNSEELCLRGRIALRGRRRHSARASWASHLPRELDSR